MRKVFKYTLLALNLTLILCLALGVLCTKISPERNTLLPYFGLLYPFFLILNVVFCLFWICARKWFFIISLSALLLCTVYTKNVFPLSLKPTPTVSDGERQLSILSYNVAIFRGGKQFDSIFSFIERKKPDIVCLQEFGFYKNSNLDRERDKVFRQFKKYYPYQHVWYKNQFKSKDYGVVTFSKYPIIKKQKIFYDSKYNISIFSDIVVGKDTIRVFNNHLESVKISSKEKKEVNDLHSEEILTQETLMLTESLLRKLGSAFKVRAKQADEVAYAVRQSPYKTIVCGDFNDMPISYTYQKIKGNLQDLYVSTACGFNYTYHDMAMFLRIDYIFASAEFLPVDCEIFHINLSDHDPVLGRVILK